MNQYIPDWSSSMGDTFAPLSGGGGGEDDGLIELLWCNGHVVMQSQALRKPPRPDKVVAVAAVQDDDQAAAAAWFQYPVEDPLERDLFSELFGEAQASVDGAARACKEETGRGGEAAPYQTRMMMMPPPLPRLAHKACLGQGDAGGAAAARTSGCEAPTTPRATATEGGESSMLTIGSSFCGSNHVQAPRRARGVPCDAAPPLGSAKDFARAKRDADTVTSSSMRLSRSCTTKTEQTGPGAASAAHRSGNGKRKQSDATEAEDVEFESADATCEPAQKTTTAKRRRAAEVHNLSERRRRDRINEKMKALQELIPHCNKTDKASMLDEAIEYLKSLQLQLQMMWMGGGMAAAAPMMFPAGLHQYMQRMVAPPHVASMPAMPFMALPAVQGPPVADLYARYLAVDHLPPPPPPPTIVAPQYTGTMGFYQQQNPVLPLPLPLPPTVPPATARTMPADGTLHKKHENCGKPEIQGMTG